MRLQPLLLILLAACSDYKLNSQPQPEAGGDGGDATGGDGETGELTDTSSGDDSGGGTSVPPDDEDVPEGRVDIVLLIDVAYFYDCYHADLAMRTGQLVDALFDSGADVAIAIASFDDYQVSGEWFAAWDGVPYVLQQQLTTDRSALATTAAGLELEWGGDGPGTGFEAIVQATGGKGFDQDCDNSFDSDTDIRPYKATGSDAFGGAVTGTQVTTTTGTGTTPGVGFRTDSSRVVVLITENALRDRSYGHEIPAPVCPGVATAADAGDAIKNIDAKFLGINAYEFQDIDTTPQEQLEDLATRTNSKIDYDGDGARDDLAVMYGDWDWPAIPAVVAAVWDLVGP